MLHLVDDVAARGKCLAAMGACDTDPDGKFAEAERAEPVHAAGAANTEAAHGLGDDALAFLGGEFGVGLVLEARDRAAVVHVAHPALEAGVAAGGRVCQGATQGVAVERLFAEFEGGHLSHRRPAE